MADRKNAQKNIKAAMKSSKNKLLFETIKEQINDLKQCTQLFDDLKNCAQSMQKNIEKMEDVFHLAMKLQDMKNISKDLDMLVKEKEKIYQEKILENKLLKQRLSHLLNKSKRLVKIAEEQIKRYQKRQQLYPLTVVSEENNKN
ncbi:unnamed protein product [Onchocerca flexuosa]|uniref:Biogenesis of lysosome-related organelles complex 1 subunit KXD1 n=1 Tax=Onchocerca flexuosa TaxID=387005 RepID=A0A183I0I8_9BILA|nr:unnamed protein product [Onchocerca flexuosa]